MRLASFFLISALLHAAIFALAFSPPRKGDGDAIPVRLVIIQDGSDHEPILQHNATAAKATAKPPATGQHRTPRKKQEDGRKSLPFARLKNPRPLDKKAAGKKPVTERLAAGPSMADVSQTRDLSSSQKSEAEKPNYKDEVQTPSVKPSPDLASRIDTGIGRGKIVDEFETHSVEEPVESVARLEVSDWLMGEDGSEAPAVRKLSKAGALEPEDLHGGTATNGANENGSGAFIRADYAYRVNPEYPEQARREGWEGTTLLKVLVDEQGNSRIVQVSRSSGFEILDRAATMAVKGWRFHPARYGAKPVESWVKIPIIFSLEGEEIVNR